MGLTFSDWYSITAAEDSKSEAAKKRAIRSSKEYQELVELIGPSRTMSLQETAAWLQKIVEFVDAHQ